MTLVTPRTDDIGRFPGENRIEVVVTPAIAKGTIMRISSVSHSVAWLVVVACVALAGVASAQADKGTLLKGKDVTEANLVDALTPADSPSADADATVRKRGLRVTINNSHTAEVLNNKPHRKPSAALLITFETNSAALTARSKEQLDLVGTALKNDKLKDFNFTVEGHADQRGAPDANLLLSQQRADSVRSYLVSTQNVAESRLRAVGKGDTEPMNTRDVAAPENRRVAITTLAN